MTAIFVFELILNCFRFLYFREYDKVDTLRYVILIVFLRATRIYSKPLTYLYFYKHYKTSKKPKKAH
jgi:hypothetical protein